MNSRLRVGILSGVRHAGPYLDVLRRDPRVRLVGLAEERTAPQWALDDGRRVADQYGVPFEGTLDRMLDGGEVDAVVVCTEPVRHMRVASRALAAGLHVIIDKPVTTTLADAKELLAVAREADGFCTVVNRTHSAALRRARGWVDAGHVGLPLHVDYECLASGTHLGSSVERPELIFDPKFAGGGELLNFLGYGVDAARYLTGLEPVEVCAMAGTLFEFGHRAHGLEDTAVVSLELERGVTATLTVGRVPFAPGQGAAHCSFRLLGSHGHATGDDNQPVVRQYGPGGAVMRPIAGARPADALVAFFDHVITRLLADTAPDYSLHDAWRTVQVIDAAYRSVESKRSEPVGAAD